MIHEQILMKISNNLEHVIPTVVERSLNMSVGPEWTTREMYQKITKPRVTIKAGAVVSPLERE